jgi:ubiquitin-protein ligase
MHQSPRTRRLRNDLVVLERLRSESSVFRFIAHGDPPHQYMISFNGKGLCRDHGRIEVFENHRIEIKLGASYPRTVPEIRWITPIYHPNIAENGMVCLGGYGAHWVPSVQLDDLCMILWDMLRYRNFDPESAYNRDAARWTKHQSRFHFPIDGRSLRDRLTERNGVDPASTTELSASGSQVDASSPTVFHAALPATNSEQSRSGLLVETSSTTPPRAAPPPEVDLHTQLGNFRNFIEALERHRNAAVRRRSHFRRLASIRRLVDRFLRP